ncbi:YheU family protein [Oryzomonas sagensis]|uniref:YheU family protein n=1 Tax=Oryzomonas sagensis TaxID=2603857 RepID=A0ABQ6TSJ2_9BACT|nr:YheU family protein [Oryzomonas sagensis]KAB0671974.1 YheU family protein [Oryzomonas sagensis]
MSTTEQTDHHEEGVEIPYELINPDTLRNLIGEFVTREWEESGEASYTYTLDQKIEQVLRQLREGKARIVFDATSESCNIVPYR